MALLLESRVLIPGIMDVGRKGIENGYQQR